MKKYFQWGIIFDLEVLSAVILSVFFVWLLAFQITYSKNDLPIFLSVNGVAVGGLDKASAISKIDLAYQDLNIPIYLGGSSQPYLYFKPGDAGLTIKVDEQINAIDYPWYLRLIPGSIFVSHFFMNIKPSYSFDDSDLTSFVSQKFGTDCVVSKVNASLKVANDSLELIQSVDGGICDISSIKNLISSIKPVLNQDNKVILPLISLDKSEISSVDASLLGESLLKKIGDGVTLKYNDVSLFVDKSRLLGWIKFDSNSDELKYSFSEDLASEYLSQELSDKVYKKASQTVINTYNFIEISKVEGVAGQSLDIGGTLDNIKLFLNGLDNDALIAVNVTQPGVVYNRSYDSTDTGLSALMQQFASSHSGTFGVSMIELSGQNRRAGYNDSKVFTTASTYKLFVAYSALKRVEDGSWRWLDDISNGRNLMTCFDDMIVKSDNECAEAMLNKIGHKNITNEAQAIGCVNTSFIESNGIKTTAIDLAVLLSKLQTGQILNEQSSRDRLIEAMKRNIYRQGIPKGLSGVTVADKVGFLYGLLHDASIVYSSTGTYVLVILTDNSSWSTIADLASQIEALRNK